MLVYQRVMEQKYCSPKTTNSGSKDRKMARCQVLLHNQLPRALVTVILWRNVRQSGPEIWLWVESSGNLEKMNEHEWTNSSTKPHPAVELRQQPRLLFQQFFAARPSQSGRPLARSVARWCAALSSPVDGSIPSGTFGTRACLGVDSENRWCHSSAAGSRDFTSKLRRVRHVSFHPIWGAKTQLETVTWSCQHHVPSSESPGGIAPTPGCHMWERWWWIRKPPLSKLASSWHQMAWIHNGHSTDSSTISQACHKIQNTLKIPTELKLSLSSRPNQLLLSLDHLVPIDAEISSSEKVYKRFFVPVDDVHAFERIHNYVYNAKCMAFSWPRMSRNPFLEL